MLNRNSERIFTLDRANCCMISVDMQDKILSATIDHEVITKKALGILDIANMLSIPTVSITHCVDKMGPVTESLSSVLSSGSSYTKETFSIFRTPEIERGIDELKRDQLILFGVETHICVVQSVLDARELGYNVFVVEDACSSIRLDDKKSSLDRMRMAGVSVLSAQAVAFELIEKAATDEFKKVFPIAKTL